MQNNRINQWLKNVYDGFVNKELIIFKITKDTPFYFKETQNFIRYVNIVDLNVAKKYRHYNNSILVIRESEHLNIEMIKTIFQKNVILIEDSNSINKMISLIPNKESDEKDEIHYYLLEKIDFEHILKLHIDEIKQFILYRETILQKINYSFTSTGHEVLNGYLDLYEHRGVLLASFAQSLYRLATLDFISTTKAVGLTIHQTLGVKSKVIHPKSLKIQITPSLMKNQRAYILNKNQIEIDIKTTIAERLVKLCDKKLDIKNIAEATELPLRQIEKIYKSCFIR